MNTMVKRILLVAFSLCIAWLCYAGDTIRVLCIGNSFSMDAVEQYLWEMAHADDVELIIGDAYYPGCSLEQHVTFHTKDTAAYTYNKIVNGTKTSQKQVTLAMILRDENWDYVSLQQASHFSGQPDTFEPWLTRLIDTVTRYCPDTKLIWHMTWAYQQNTPHRQFYLYDNLQTTMYQAILNCVNTVVKSHQFALIVPVGMAIQNARESKLGDTFCRDGFHLQKTYGRYTAACTWFEALTGLNSIENTYKPDDVSYEEMYICQRAAHKAMTKMRTNK